MNERVTLEVDAEALAAARAAGVDLSDILVRALRRYLPLPEPAERERMALQWYEDNKESVDAYNTMIEEHGLFSDGARTF